MPRIPANQLVPGEEYLRVRRNNSKRIGVYEFLGLNNGTTWPRFRQGLGTVISNPNVFNFYRPNNANIPPEPIAVVPQQVVPQPVAPQSQLVRLLAISPHIGNVAVPAGEINGIDLEDFKDGEEIVIITQGGYKFYYHIGSLNEYYKTTPNINVINPATNLPVGNKVTGVLVQGVTVQRARVSQQVGGSRKRSKTYRKKTKKTRKSKRNTHRNH